MIMNEQELINHKLELYREELTFYLDYCKSPIEKILSIELADLTFEWSYFDKIEILDIVPQKNIYIDKKHYIADFLIEILFKHNDKNIAIMNLIIECDGHEFHERTKEQVIKDNQRNRDLLNNDYHILHFSGSEIYNTSTKCKREIIKYILNQYYKTLNNYLGE